MQELDQISNKKNEEILRLLQEKNSYLQRKLKILQEDIDPLNDSKGYKFFVSLEKTEPKEGESLKDYYYSSLVNLKKSTNSPLEWALVNDLLVLVGNSTDEDLREIHRKQEQKERDLWVERNKVIGSEILWLNTWKSRMNLIFDVILGKKKAVRHWA